MTEKPDRRRNAWREDLAAAPLRGRVEAPRYVEGVRKQVIAGIAPLRRHPRPDAGLDTEVLLGETMMEYAAAEGWSWVQLERDCYVGYVPSATLSREVRAAGHRVNALASWIYPRADFKAPPLMCAHLNSPLAVESMSEGYCRLASGGYISARHVSEQSRTARDFVDVAERFIGTPYLWGGRTRLGLDCSGLVQTAMEAAGLSAPRDSDMQAREIGTPVLVPADLEGLRRGDIVCWPGHVGIMLDGVMLLHANAHHMAVVAEPLTEAAERIARGRDGLAISAIRRPDALGGEASPPPPA